MNEALIYRFSFFTAYSCNDFIDRAGGKRFKWHKYCFVSRITKEEFCIGYSSTLDGTCSDLIDGIRLAFSNEPMRFNKAGETYCQNYNIGYLQNLANALGYGNYKVNTKRSRNGCRSVWLKSNGYFESSSTAEYGGDMGREFPQDVQFYH